MLNKIDFKTLKNLNQDLVLAVLSFIIIGLITAQNIYLSDFGFETSMRCFYNNYLIFKNSAIHLINNENLYVLYRQQQIDLFKYSPTFSFFFLGLTFLPNWLGLFLWNALNVLVLFSLRKISFSKSSIFFTHSATAGAVRPTVRPIFANDSRALFCNCFRIFQLSSSIFGFNSICV